MKVILLGTGDSVGTPKVGCQCQTCLDALDGGRSRRLRFTIMIENMDQRVLIDTSPDLRWQLIRMGGVKIDAVIWTHSHYDHYAGFGDFHRVQENVPVYGQTDTLDYILRYLYFMDPVRRDVQPYESFELIGLEWTLFDMDHPPLDYNAGVLIETPGGERVAITGDTTLDIPQRSMSLMQDVDLLVADAIVPPKYKVIKHMNSKEAMELAQKVNAENVVLTHISHYYPPHDEAVEEWPLGHDGMTIELG